MKRTLILFLTILVLSAGWSAGWYYVAGKVEQALDKLQKNLFRNERSIDCEDQLLSGYPFRISITCSRSGFRDVGAGFSFSAGEIRTASQVYQPGKAVMEIDGPAVLQLSLGEVFDLNWDSLRASVFANLSGPDRFSVSSRAFSFTPRDQRFDQFNASEVQFHGRRVEVNDADLAVISQEVVSLQKRWPSFSLLANIRVSDAFDKLLQRPDIIKLGRETGLFGNVTEIKYLLTTGGEVRISGPFEVSPNGLLSGAFDIETEKITKLLEGLEKVIPENRDLLSKISQSAALLGGADGRGSIKFKVSVKEGRAAIGLIPIGRIPPLY